jgi:hypothetical protein
MKTQESKNAFFSFLLLFGIEPFQWLAADSSNFFFLLRIVLSKARSIKARPGARFIAGPPGSGRPKALAGIALSNSNCFVMGIVT